MPKRTQEVYRPNRAWCTEVAELDEKLYGLGLPDISEHSLWRPARRTFHWHGHHIDDSFMFDSGRSMTGLRHLGSVILWINDYDQNLEPGHSAVRSVSYRPSLIYGRPPTTVTDRSYSVANLSYLLSAESTPAERQTAGDLIRADIDMQEAAGMSKPTAETYAFILGALRLADKSTRPAGES